MKLREAVEDMKQFYIQKLMEAGAFDDSKTDPSLLTFSELEKMMKLYKL